MKVSTLITKLQEIQAEHGPDIKITGGYMTDDTVLSKVSVLNTDASIYTGQKGETVEGIFFE